MLTGLLMTRFSLTLWNKPHEGGIFPALIVTSFAKMNSIPGRSLFRWTFRAVLGLSTKLYNMPDSRWRAGAFVEAQVSGKSHLCMGAVPGAPVRQRQSQCHGDKTKSIAWRLYKNLCSFRSGYLNPIIERSLHSVV